MRELFRRIHLSAATDRSVLIEGETGTGKDLVAQALHRQSPRAAGPFVAINASTIPEPLFESELFGHVRGAFSGAQTTHRGLISAAHKGTLFIDEIGELPPANQAKLLRFLDTREIRPVGGLKSTPVDIRIVCATNRDLLAAVEQRSFRADLFYRLRAIWLKVPSLRDRHGDLPLLIAHFLCELCRQDRRPLPTLARETMAHLLSYDWPGNVRELKQELSQAVVLTPPSQTIGPQALTPCVRRAKPSCALRGENQPCLSTCREQAEREVILATLEHVGWNVSEAARRLEISRVGLSRKLRTLGVRRPGRVAGRREQRVRAATDVFTL